MSCNIFFSYNICFIGDSESLDLLLFPAAGMLMLVTYGPRYVFKRLLSLKY